MFFRMPDFGLKAVMPENGSRLRDELLIALGVNHIEVISKAVDFGEGAFAVAAPVAVFRAFVFELMKELSLIHI